MLILRKYYELQGFFSIQNYLHFLCLKSYRVSVICYYKHKRYNNRISFMPKSKCKIVQIKPIILNEHISPINKVFKTILLVGTIWWNIFKLGTSSVNDI